MDRELLLFLFIFQPIRTFRATLGGFTGHGLLTPALPWLKQAIPQPCDLVMPLTSHYLETALKDTGSQLKTFH